MMQQHHTMLTAHNEPEATAATISAGIYSTGLDVIFYANVTRDNVRLLNDALAEADAERARLAYQLRRDTTDVVPIRLHIHSEGGDVFSTFDAVDAITNTKPVHTMARGLCASGATLMFLAGEKRFVTPHTFLMAHQLSAMFVGTYEQFQNEKRLQDMLMAQMVEFYAARTGQTADEIREMLKRDSWLDAADAVRLGFAHEVLK